MAALLRGAHPGLEVELVFVETTGDQVRDRPIHELGGQGVFVKEVQAAVLDGRADLAVHSAKDLPSLTATGLVLACVPERADARDGLIGSSLAGLAHGATVATGSVRRRAQLAHVRPDLAFVELRGNMHTRLERVPEGGAVVAAVAALERLGLADRLADRLPVEVMLPQVAQGALAVEARDGDHATRSLLAAIEHPASRVAVDCERAWLAAIGGGCDLPVGAHATVLDDEVHLDALVASLDGSRVVRRSAAGALSDPGELGRRLAAEVLDAGGSDLLAASR